jgi:hypothetical protein
MVHIHHTARKSTEGHLTVGQLARHGTLCQHKENVELQQPKHVELQQEESAEP